MSIWKDILIGMEDKLEAETGWDWETLDSLYEETGYGITEVYEMYETFKTGYGAEDPRDFTNFYDFVTDGLFRYDEDGTLILDANQKPIPDRWKCKISSHELLQLFG